MSRKSESELNENEVQRRFEKLVRTALNTPPKPMRDMPRKRPAEKPKPAKGAKAPS